MKLAEIQRAITDAGLAFRGAFHPDADDLVPGLVAGTIVLAGIAGGRGWDAFAASPEAGDGRPNPLDRWSFRVVGDIGRAVGARALFPFARPFLPFVRWGQKAEPLHPSPLGLLIHPDFGLWHAWRGALAFSERLALPAPDARSSPCETCETKPCLSACPVGAFASGAFDVRTCATHLMSPQGADCTGSGCRARHACPVGAQYRYRPAQARFHMRAFLGQGP